MRSCHKKIENEIDNMPEGSVFVTSDFSDIAEEDNVSKILTRLTKTSYIKRILRGVYWCPKKSKEKKDTLEDPRPDPNNVALALARNNNQRVIPCGETALHVMGLSDKEPEEWTYITDGAYHEYEYGDTHIKFKHAAGKFFNKMSDKTSLVVQALKAYGKDYLNKETLSKIKSKLTVSEMKKLLKEAKNTTEWIYEIVKQLCGSSDKENHSASNQKQGDY